MDYESVEVYKSGEKFIIFTHIKKIRIITSQSSYLMRTWKKGEPILLDSTSLKIGENFSEFKIVKSKNNAYFLIYKYEFSAGRIDKMFSLVINSEAALLQKRY